VVALRAAEVVGDCGKGQVQGSVQSDQTKAARTIDTKRRGGSEREDVWDQQYLGGVVDPGVTPHYYAVALSSPKPPHQRPHRPCLPQDRLGSSRDALQDPGGQRRTSKVSQARVGPLRALSGRSGSRGPSQRHPGPRRTASGHVGPRRDARTRRVSWDVSGSRQVPRATQDYAGPAGTPPGIYGPRRTAPVYTGPRRIAQGIAESLRSAWGYAGTSKHIRGHAGMQERAGCRGVSQGRVRSRGLHSTAQDRLGPLQASMGHAGPRQCAQGRVVSRRASPSHLDPHGAGTSKHIRHAGPHRASQGHA
jgi:hypothetical protein